MRSRVGDSARVSAVAAENAASLRGALGRANGWAVLHDDAATAIRNVRPRQQRAVITNPTTPQRDVADLLDGFFGSHAPHYRIDDHWGRD